MSELTKKERDRERGEPAQHVMLNAPRMKISKITGIKFPENTLLINLQDNELASLDGLPTIKTLRYLQLDGNPIKSFAATKAQPGLRWLSLKGAPITKNPYFTLMALIAFGPNVVVINNTKVDEFLQNMAKAMTHRLRPSIRQGLVISNLKPLRMYKPSTRHKTAVPDQPKTSVAILCDFVNACDNARDLPQALKTQFVQKLAQIRQKHAFTDTEIIPDIEQTTGENPFEFSDDGDPIPPFSSDDE